MKRIITTTVFLLLLIPLYDVHAISSIVATRMEGKILLQVESKGEAWYVKEGIRYYMKDGNAAYDMMRNFGLGIKDTDLSKISAIDSTDAMKLATSVCASSALANKLRGKILLQVEQKGEAWYVDTGKCRRIYMKDGNAAYQIMRYLSTGITNTNLNTIPSGDIAVDANQSSSESLSAEAIADGIKYIRNAEFWRKSSDTIKSELKSVGWTDADIQELYKAKIAADKERAAKIPVFEKEFTAATKYGVNYALLDITKNYLLIVDDRDLMAIARKFNHLSALMHVALFSKNSRIQKVANDARDDFLVKQKFYFQSFRNDYINYRNENMKMDDKFEYPYRCYGADCGQFEFDSFCKANMTQDEQVNEYLDIFRDDLRELHVGTLTINFSASLDGTCNASQKVVGINSALDNESGLSDVNLLPYSYLGI